MDLKKLTYVLSPFLLGALVVQPASAEEPTSVAEVLATVNGQPVSRDMFAIYFQERLKKIPGTDLTTEHQIAALNELINIMLIAEDAEKRKLADKPEVAAALELQHDQLLTRVAIQEYTRKNLPDDETVQKAYDEKYKGKKLVEYKASHILLEKEDDAKIVIAELDKGADFVEMAKQHSTGPSKQSGGDLGWFQSEQMVPEFAKAVATLEKGSFTKAPVKTPFGWHIIRLEDQREVEPPSFEKAKDQLRVDLSKQKLETYIADLRAKAKVQFSSDSGGKAE